MAASAWFPEIGAIAAAAVASDCVPTTQRNQPPLTSDAADFSLERSMSAAGTP